MPLNCRLICFLSAHTISSLSLCASEDFLGQRLSGEPESVWVWAGEGHAAAPGAGLLLAGEQKEINISWVLEAQGCAWSCQEDELLPREARCPLALSARGTEGLSGPAAAGRSRNFSGTERNGGSVLPLPGWGFRNSSSTRRELGGAAPRCLQAGEGTWPSLGSPD